MRNIDGRACSDRDAGFIQDLYQALNGEYSAIFCYKHLAKHAPSRKEKKRILEIRDDEIKHFKVFEHIYFALTGSKPQPQITEECPEHYRQGLEEAFEDEQKTTDFYNEIADRVNDLCLKEQFRRFAIDEQNHAVWFSYFYFKNC